MEPDKSYFMDEIRDGFLIPSMMKRLWAKNLKIYKELENICEENGVNCSALWGTLIGAVRNAGYIPWDDDIDVEMKRDEYGVIEKLDREKKLPDDCWINDYMFTEKEDMVRHFTSTKSLVEPYDTWKENYGFPFAGIIDIFLQDYMPKGGEEEKEFWDVLEGAGDIKEREKARNHAQIDVKLERDIKELSKKLSYPLDRRSDIPMFIQILQAMDAFCESYTAEKYDYIAIPAYYRTSKSRIIPKELYAAYIDVKFEYGTVKAPVGYDGILRRFYGNCMIPSIYSDSHNYPIYDKMNSDARKVSGFELSSYHIDDEFIKENRKKLPKGEGLKGELMKSLSLLREAHEYIVQELTGKGASDDICELISQCQELAIQMGESIETRALEGDVAVQTLERYCEYIYSLYQTLSEKDGILNTDEFERGLKDYEKKLLDELTGIKGKRELVFITHKADDWRSLHTLWETASADSEWLVTVICVPYYYRDYEQKILRDELIIETDRYPEKVEITSYEEYDFESRHPDVIVHQHPYDEYNGAISIHPFYYMSNLYKYTDCMVLIPPFKLREVSQGYQMRFSLGTYVKTPGVVFSDVIFVQSDEMKSAWEDIRNEFLKEEEYTRGNLACDIASVGALSDDWESRQRTLVRNSRGDVFTKSGEKAEATIYDVICDVSDDVFKKIRRTDGDFKKVLIYHLSGSMLYEWEEQGIDKAKKIFENMQKNSEDYLVVWKEDEYVESILKDNKPSIWEAYGRLKEWFLNEDVGVFESADESLNTEYLCDYMYGDACSLMNKCRVLRKPAILQNPEAEPVFDKSVDNSDVDWPEKCSVVSEGDRGSGRTLGDLISIEDESECTRKDSGTGKKIFQRLIPKKKQIAVIYDEQDICVADRIINALSMIGRYEISDCMLTDKKSIQEYYMSWSVVPHLVLTVNLAGFGYRSSGGNSVYATLNVNAIHYIDRNVENERELLSGLIPITMKFVVESEKRKEKLLGEYRRIHDVSCVESIENDIVKIVEMTDWRRED